jgi:bromodomain-containing factor 1
LASPDASTNDDAFAANGGLSAETSSKPAAEKELDTETNGEKPSEEPAKAKEESTKKEEAEVQAPASPPKSATPKPAANDDSMDIDTSTERPDLTSSAEHGESTQDTSVISDSAIVASPQEPSQTADVSKLEIQSPQDESHGDITMPDRASTPTKVAREREEDNDDEPLAKRTKLVASNAQNAGTPNEKAGDSIGVASGLSPPPSGSADEFTDDVPDDQIVTQFHSREIRKELARVKKTKNGMNFRTSVEKLWPGIWENYKALIVDPVDLSLFEAKFRDMKYTTFGEFKADLRRLYDNSLKYNGPANVVTIAASRVRHDLFNKISEIAKTQEPARIEKGKAQPTRHTEPRAATQPRRQSQSLPQAVSPKSKPESAPSVASTTPVSTTAPAFAIPPNGIPQIRRDSTRDDGDRPKRPIHPPKNRDPDYASQGSRKRKLEPEMKFYSDVLSDLKKSKYWGQNQWFLEPVDPVALNIPTYFSIVKKPMDLKSMTEKLESGEYRSGKEVEKDMKQIVNNSELFNGEGVVTNMARELEQLFRDKLAEKESWMAKNYPPSAPSVANSAHTPEPSDHEIEESDGEAPEDSESIRNVQSRLTEEQSKLDAMLAAKRPDITMVEIQQNVVQMLQRKLVEEKSKASTTKKPKSQKKSTNKAKPKSSSSHTVGASSKKAAGGANVSSNKNRPTTTKKSQPKKRAISLIHKQVITEGISELDGPTLDKAVDIIKKDTNQRVGCHMTSRYTNLLTCIFQEDDDGQLELDIEVLSQDALWKLFELINRAYPNIYDTVSKRPEFSNHDDHQEPARPKASGGTSKPKKNKPMNKQEQERNIEKLRELKAQFNRQGSGSQEPVPTEEQIMQAGHSSEEESDSEEE